MSVENLERIVSREIRVRRRQRVYLAGFVASIVVVLAALLSL